MSEKSYAEVQEAYMRERVAGIGKSLHRMAEEIEREAWDKPLPALVSDAIHTVTWGVANLGLDILVDNLERYSAAVKADEEKEA